MFLLINEELYMLRFIVAPSPPNTPTHKREETKPIK